MKKLLILFLIVFSVFMVNAQTRVTVWDSNPNDGQVSVYFSNPNVDVVRYVITYTKDGENTGSVIFSDTTFCFVGGLESGTYVFYVQARDLYNNSIDEQAQSKPITVINPEIPYAPYPTLKLNDDYSVCVNWVKSVNANSYKVEWSNDPYFFSGELYSKVVSPEQTSLDVYTDNGVWYFRIFAIGDLGTGEPNYIYPSIIVDKPLSTDLLVAWFTDNDWWKTVIYITLPEDSNQAKLSITCSFPYPSTLQLTNTVYLNGDQEHKGVVYKFTPQELFGGLAENGRLTISSDTVGIKATVEISATNSEMVDSYQAVDFRELKTEYQFAGLLLKKKGDGITKGDNILAFAISNGGVANNELAMVVRITDKDNNVIAIDQNITFTLEGETTTGAWLMDDEYLNYYEVSEYDELYCTVIFKSTNDKPFYVLASNQVSNSPTGLMFASWIEPK